jgi:septal ring-binding cell division protein DamX
MAEQNKKKAPGHRGNVLMAFVIILLLLLLLLGALLAWAFMRLNDLEGDMDSANGTRTTQGGAETNGGSGSTRAPSTTSPTNGGGTTGTPGESGDDSSTTVECPPPSQRATLPTGEDICVSIDPFPNL